MTKIYMYTLLDDVENDTYKSKNQYHDIDKLKNNILISICENINIEYVNDDDFKHNDFDVSIHDLKRSIKYLKFQIDNAFLFASSNQSLRIFDTDFDYILTLTIKILNDDQYELITNNTNVNLPQKIYDIDDLKSFINIDDYDIDDDTDEFYLNIKNTHKLNDATIDDLNECNVEYIIVAYHAC